MSSSEIVTRPATDVPVVATAGVVVVGGGPAGVAAAVSAARNGAPTILVERYPYLGGLASGGMVLVLDDMHNDTEISVRGLAMEIIDRMHAKGLCVYPPEADRDPSVRATEALWRKWSRWGVFDFHVQSKPHPIIFAAAFDPDGFKQASLDMVREAGVDLRLHSWFQSTIVEDGRAAGVIVQTKEGAQAIRAEVVVDATGDLDVAASAGSPFTEGSYIVSTVSRIGGVDTDAAERFQFEEPERFAAVDRQAKRLIGNSWNYWWLKTPLPGIVWCNCPHMTGFDAMKVADLTAAEFEGRRRMQALLAFVRENMPGFERAYFVDFAPQTGVRQTRLLQGEYVVTKQDVKDRVHFHDSVCRGRDYYTPYRALLPVGCGPVAGRRPPLLGDAVGPEDEPGDPALHGHGRGRRHRRGPGARRRHPGAGRGRARDPAADAGARRRPRRPSGGERAGDGGGLMVNGHDGTPETGGTAGPVTGNARPGRRRRPCSGQPADGGEGDRMTRPGAGIARRRDRHRWPSSGKPADGGDGHRAVSHGSGTSAPGTPTNAATETH